MNELRPKLFDVMKGYTKEQLIKDILSGIIVAIIALPLSIALAIASGVGPVQGLYTAIVAGFFISFFGGSRVQIGGPTAAFVVIIYGIVTTYGTDGLIVATIMAGIILCIMGLCHFGSLIKYIPYTITTGFTCGIAVVAFRTKCKIFSRHLQKPILKKKKDVLKGCKIPSKTSFSYCFFFGFRFPCSSTIRSFPVILC